MLHERNSTGTRDPAQACLDFGHAPVTGLSCRRDRAPSMPLRREAPLVAGFVELTLNLPCAIALTAHAVVFMHSIRTDRPSPVRQLPGFAGRGGTSILPCETRSGRDHVPSLFLFERDRLRNGFPVRGNALSRRNLIRLRALPFEFAPRTPLHTPALADCGDRSACGHSSRASVSVTRGR